MQDGGYRPPGPTGSLDVPPGYEPPPGPETPDFSGYISDVLISHPWIYWITTFVFASMFGEFILFVLFFTPTSALYVGAYLHHKKLIRKANQHFEQQLRYVESRRSWAWQVWSDTRIIPHLQKADYPSTAARQYLNTLRASAVIGIDKTIHREFVVLRPRESMVVIGPSGAGKTIGVAVPAVSLHPGPAMFSSTKIDGLRNTALARSAIGRLWLFDPNHAISDDEVSQIEKETGTRIYRAYWSPLFGIRGWDDAKLVAKDIVTAAKYGENSGVNSRHWNVTAEEYLTPMLLAAALHPDGSMNVVRRWIRDHDIKECSAILAAINYNSGYELDIELALGSLKSRQGDRNVRHSSDVWSTLNTLIEAYDFTHAMSNAHRQNFDPHQFVCSSDTLYIAGQARLQEAAAPLYVALIDTLYEACVVLDRRQPFEQGTRPTLLVALDEAANSAPSPRLIRYLSEGPGQGFQLMVFLQSLAQAETIWGRHGRSLLDFVAVKVIFGGLSDRDTLEAFSVLLGDYDRAYLSSTNSQSYGENWSAQKGKSWGLRGGSNFSESTSTGGSRTFGSSETVSWHKERQMTPGDIANLGRGEALVVTRESWQTCWVGGPLISEWLKILRSPNTPIQHFDEPKEIQRPTLELAHIDDLVAWHRENEKFSAKEALDKSRRLHESDDDDDDDDVTYALEGPRL